MTYLKTGGTGQFAAVPLNLLGKSIVPDYIITGKWSQTAVEEAKLYSNPSIVCNGMSNSNINIPDKSTWSINPSAPYLYYCDNETIHGVEFPFIPEPAEGVPLVVDMSSNFLTRRFDPSKFGVIFAGAQKNCGTSGVTIIIVRDDLLNIEKIHPVPSVLHWKKNSDQNSCLNTPPVMAVYIAGLVFKWTLRNGGIQAMEELSQKKSKIVYDVIDHSNGFYISLVDTNYRSRVNIVFKIKTKTLEEMFLKESNSRGFVGLAGHRSLGGIRVSLYNAISLDDTLKLSSFMKEFMEINITNITK